MDNETEYSRFNVDEKRKGEIKKWILVALISAVAVVIVALPFTIQQLRVKNVELQKIQSTNIATIAELQYEILISGFVKNVSHLTNYQNVSDVDCKYLYDSGIRRDGVYTIFNTGYPLKVWCDMSSGGSIVLMKRYDGSLNCSQTFQKYSDGFGDVAAEYWLGLKHMNRLTEFGNWTLRIDLERFSNNTNGNENITAYAEYNDFRIGCATDFNLKFDPNSYRGNGGDSLSFHHGASFSTHDNDQDTHDRSCSLLYGGKGGWWFKKCCRTILTGMPYGSGYSIYWKSWTHWEVLKGATMKIMRN